MKSWTDLKLFELTDRIVWLAHNHPAFLIVLALALLFFMIRKPKLFLSLLLICLFLAGMLYVIMNMSGSGSQKKERLIQEENAQFDTGQ